MSPTPNGSSVLQRFECGNALEIRNGIMFDFYPGLPHMFSSSSWISPPLLFLEQGYISYPRTETTHYPKDFDFKSILTDFKRHPEFGEYAACILQTGIKPPRYYREILGTKTLPSSFSPLLHFAFILSLPSHLPLLPSFAISPFSLLLPVLVLMLGITLLSHQCAMPPGTN